MNIVNRDGITNKRALLKLEAYIWRQYYKSGLRLEYSIVINDYFIEKVDKLITF